MRSVSVIESDGDGFWDCLSLDLHGVEVVINSLQVLLVDLSHVGGAV